MHLRIVTANVQRHGFSVATNFHDVIVLESLAVYVASALGLRYVVRMSSRAPIVCRRMLSGHNA